jgi:hypothetical protein
MDEFQAFQVSQVPTPHLPEAMDLISKNFVDPLGIS